MDTMSFVGSHPLFEGLSPSAVRAISRKMSLTRLGKGELLGLEGEACEAIYWVTSGRLVALKQSANGREQVVSVIQTGEPIYLIPVLDGGPLPVTTQSTDESELIRLAKDDLLQLLQEHPPIALRLLTLFATRLRRMTLLIEDLSLKSVPERLARMLVERTKHTPQARLTQREMAAMLGTVREVVARSLAQFERDGWINVKRGRIEILDLAALRSLAQDMDIM